MPGQRLPGFWSSVFGRWSAGDPNWRIAYPTRRGVAHLTLDRAPIPVAGAGALIATANVGLGGLARPGRTTDSFNGADLVVTHSGRLRMDRSMRGGSSKRLPYVR